MNNSLEILEWLLECGCPLSDDIERTVASFANLKTLRCLWEKGVVQRCLLCQPKLPSYIRANEELSLEFICVEHCELTRWLHKYRSLHQSELCVKAVEEGNLPALRYTFNSDAQRNERLYLVAISHAHLHILQWLYEQKVPLQSTLFCQVAATSGQLKVLQWLREHGAPWDERTFNEPASEGHL